MVNIRRVFLTGVLFFSGVSFAFADNVVTLETFLKELEGKHPFLMSEMLRYDIAAARRDSTTGSADFKFQASADHNYQEAVSIDTFSAPISQKTTGKLGIGKEVWATGGNFSADIQTIYSDSKTSPYLDYYNIDSRYAYNQISVAYKQPLLKNRGGFLSSYYYDNEDFTVKMSELISADNMENFNKQQAFSFLDLVMLGKQKDVYAKRLVLSENELKRTEDKFNSGLVDKVDVLRAKDSVRIAKQNLKLVSMKEESTKAKLNVILQSDILEKSSPVETSITEGFISTETHNANKKKLKENSRILKVADLQIQQLKHSKEKYVQEKKGDLSLYTKYTVKDSDKTFRTAQNFNKQDAQIGVYYSIPWGNREAKSRIKEFDLKIKQAKNSLSEQYLNLKANLDSLYIQIKDTEDVLALNKEQIASAKEKTEEELKLYNQGRTQYTFVISAQDNEQNAQLNYITNLINYKKLVISYLEINDSFYLEYHDSLKK